GKKKASFRRSRKARKYGAPDGPRRRRGWVARLLRFLFNLALILPVFALATLSVMYAYVQYKHQDQSMEGYPSLIQNSVIYDRNGEEIWELPGAEHRWTVAYGELGPHLPRAIVAVEDMRFYKHHGFSLESIGRAALEDIRARDIRQGGSTITEQLVKNLYIDEERRGDTSFMRRFEQAVLSFHYEREHTKREILTAYLNTVYFGDGAYGAEAAARSYFGKSARDLTLPEAAAIASFLDAPSIYRQNRELEGSARAKESRDTVLRLMKEQGMISEAEMREAINTPLEFVPPPPPDDPDFESFTEQVYREVAGELGQDAVVQGGLRIFTTLEPGMQKEAVASTREVLNLPDDPSGAVATVEPQTGAIRALAGREGEFNLALDARRQPGSSFKAFVLAAALRENVSPQTVYLSGELDVPFDGKNVHIENYDSVERGPITVEEAMAESDNTVFVQFALDLGLDNVVGAARAMGVTSHLDPFPSTAIGGLNEGVSPLQMASAYATFAAGGIHREPYSVERVERVRYGERETLHDHRIQGRRALSSNQAAAATQVLRGVVEDGTASMFHDLDKEIGRPSVGKTGTTDDFADAWYVGYTPRLATAVWVGFPEGRVSMRDIHGERVVNGETLPMDVWSRYMARATEGQPVLDFPAADESELQVLNRGYARDLYVYSEDPALFSSVAEQ
ncbi:MAG: transglycosylase domain-containing protein, partial [Rubrobacter sp.]